MMQTSSSLSYPARQENYGLGKLPRVRKRMERSSCIGRVWIFLLLGVILVILGLVVVGVYLNVQMTTSSTTYTEIFPMYINAALIIGAGLTVVPMFWRRLKIMVFSAVVVSMVTGLFSGITAVVTTTHILQPVRSFTRCRYYQSQELCQCFSPYFRDGLDIQYLENEESKYDFEDTSSCSAIQDTLTQLLFTLITVLAIALLLCIGASVVALLVLRIEINKRRFCEDEDYEEVYTVSASSDASHNQSDSETDVATEVVTSPTGQLTAAVNQHATTNTGTSLGHVTLPANQETALTSQKPTSNVKPADNLSQKTPLTSRIKTQSSGERGSSDKLRSSRRNSKSSKLSDQEIGNPRSSLTFTKRLSRSCDSLDTSGCQGDTQNQDFGTTQSDGKQSGKLKAHRRKGRRAVTLHNLDTKQLMLILNLQMRYLEETKAYHSQKDLRSVPNPRRAITPQPSSHQPKLPQNIRSHTPQPYRRQNGGISKQERDFYAQIQSLYQNHEGTNGHVNANYMYAGNQFSHKTLQHVKNTAPFQHEKHNPYIYDRRGNSADNVHYVTYSDNMLNLKGPKPKSRATVQDYILPPQPIHRQSKNTLPPQPIRRQKSVDQNLPSEPTHRGKSAFHIVDCGRNTSRSSSVSSERSDPPVIAIKTPKQRRQQSDYAEVAIRENFQLNESPYMLKSSLSYGKSSEKQRAPNKLPEVSSRSMKSFVSSEIPPPYTGPPSYFEFVSSCDNSGTSTSSSNQEEIYSRPVRRNMAQSSGDDKYCFEIENRSMLKGERGKNYNVRQPNLDSVYGYRETLNDVQNCHGDIKVNNVKVEGHSSAVYPRDSHNEDAVRESVYSTPPKSKVKQYIVPEDYYTPIQKVSRHTPVYANAKNVESANKPSKLYTGVSPSVHCSGRNPRDRDNTSVTHTGKLAGYIYPETKQTAPDVTYHEYEDVYDTPGNDELVLVSHKEVNEMRHTSGEKSEQTNQTGTTQNQKHSKGSPKKGKVKQCSYPNLNKHILDSEKSVNVEKYQPDQGADNPRYNIPAIIVNGGDLTEDDVFEPNLASENGARKGDDIGAVPLHGVSSAWEDNAGVLKDTVSDPRQEMEEHVIQRNSEASIQRPATQIEEGKYSAYYVVGKAANPTEGSGHVTRQASQSSESDQERQVPDGTDESSDSLVDNSSEEEYTETGV